MRIFYRTFFFLLLVTSVSAKSINVAVASNVSYAIVAITKEFKKLYPDTDVRIILGSSGKLTAQISNGAPFDIFMSADMKFPNALFAKRKALREPKVYAEGGVALLSSKKRDFSEGINIILDKKVRKIAIASPKTAPYGKASYEALQNLKLLQKVENKFVFAESISQTLSYTMVATDLGFVAHSALYAPKMKAFKEQEHWIALDASLYTPIKQGIVILENAKQNTDAKAFYDFVLSPQARKIFADFGYSTL